MKKFSKANITLFAFSLFLGIFMAIQFQRDIEPFNPVTLRSIQITKSEIDIINSEVDDMLELHKNKKEELEKMESIIEENEDYKLVLKDELNKTKAVAGFEKMEGPGIIIKMEDNQDIEMIGSEIADDVIHDIDVLNILNDLRIAGAEAISINGQRIMSVSEIKCGGPVIRINGKSVGTPFIIKAIGDPKLLSAAINAPGTYGYIQKNVYKKGLETTIEDKVIVPAYFGYFDFKYAKPVEEGD